MGRMRTPQTLRTLLALVVLWLVPLALVPACKTTGIGGVGAKIVDCAEKAIRDKAMTYLGKVNDILSNTGVTDQTAESRLIDLGVEAGEDVIGCLLTDQAPKFAEAAAGNPTDQVAKAAAKRSQTRLEELQSAGWRFTK